MGRVFFGGGKVGMVAPSIIKYLYNAGDECVDITGGWEFPQTLTGHGTPTNATSSGWVYDTSSGESSGGYVKKEKNADSIYLEANIIGGTISTATVYTTNKIDLSAYSSLCLELTDVNGSASMVYGRTVYQWPNAMLKLWGGDDTDIMLESYISDGSTLIRIDISPFKDPMYLALIAGTYSGTDHMQTIRIHKVWLEK